MSRVVIVTHEGRSGAVRAAAELENTLAAAGVAVERSGVPGATGDLVVSVGGDGTFLRAARIAWEADRPVLGVKVGRLGFLTEVEPREAADAVVSALEGRARVEERLGVVASPEDGDSFAPQWGLNEVMVEKRARHRLMRVAVHVDEEYVTTFSADGVVVATPTGSTAYSFSARGPIVAPDVGCLVLTPVAAHMVFDRSFVLGRSVCVRLRVVGDEPAVLSADGREAVELSVGSGISIRAADRPLRYVRRDDAAGFLSLVREKFDLPGEPGDGERPEPDA